MADAGYPRTKPSLCTLPLECRQEVLYCLPDLRALQSTILTHSSLYAAYASRQEHILRRVISNLISPELLPDAVLAYSSSRFDTETWTKEKVLLILEEHQSRSIPRSFQWTLQNAAELQTLHSHVQFMTQDFIQAAFFLLPYLRTKPASDAEFRRIARTFYRFEIYRHLFRQRHTPDGEPLDNFTDEDRWDIYYQCFASWELEQLASVSEHLFRKIAIPFNKIAAFDIEWGYEGIAYPLVEAWDYEWETHISHVLSKGIAFIRKVITANSYEERRRLLTPVALGRCKFLPCDLIGLTRSSADGLLPLRAYTEAQIMPHISPEAPELNPGPAWAWCQAHFESPWPYFVYDLESRDARRWGYVMWDYCRLENIGFFNAPFVPASPPEQISSFDRVQAVIDNLITRRKLFVRGARGWWCKEDESRLEWVRPWEISDEEEDIELLREIASI